MTPADAQAKPAPYTCVVDAMLILVRDGKVLLAQRQGTGYADGCWNLPSGKLEAGETVTHATVREGLEEIGVHITEDDLDFVHLCHYRNSRGEARMGVFFTARHWKGEPHNAEPHKCAQIDWFPFDALPEATYPYTAEGLAAYRRGVLFNAVGWH
ncbi:NUDIX hydrolase [Actinomadura rubrisoli]|uniref:NUDIX domain-containing protein n=1 Tax=Actinomadura rubrisoli TaxID=2530368 RepID=A0A4R5C9U4_9ACTN|nr:NUDIX domain-containing protein [Actinomadura rubrisoli]TDD93844.1 NUDIX domain-containing protein [Actinomadura rubrisoli]